MFKFTILKKSKKSQARVGQLKTNHGVVETPCLVPVATQAVVKTLTSDEAAQTDSQILIANTFHLHLKPGEKIIKAAGGLHNFMNWPRPLMTDSGGFQVFSLGFGRDFKTGKIARENLSESIKKGQQPKLLKITPEGVFFTSPIDGKKLFIGPKESIKIQETLGADIIFTFDECTPPNADKEYTKKSLKLTHQWAKICLAAKRSDQALFGIIQGGRYPALRQESSRFISSLGFDGFGIGGEFGDNKEIMTKMLKIVVSELREQKPKHLLGIGHPEDIALIIKQGIDTFDCTVPTHYARRGIAFTNFGTLNLKQSKLLKDKMPLDKECDCSVCQRYKRNYISHLIRAGEMTALKLLTFHNLYFFNSFIAKIRDKIKKGKL